GFHPVLESIPWKRVDDAFAGDPRETRDGERVLEEREVPRRVGVTRERKEATRVARERGERRRQVEPVGAAVQLDRDAARGRGGEDARPVRPDAAPDVVETSARVAEYGDAGRVERSEEAFRLVPRAPEPGVHRGDDRTELGDVARSHVEVPVLGDVGFGSQ